MTDPDEPDSPADPVSDALRRAAASAANSQVHSPTMLRAVAGLAREVARLERGPFAASRPRGRLEPEVDQEALNAWAAKWGPQS